MSRDIKFRSWNDIDNSYIDWMTLCGMPKLITNIARGKERYYQLEQYTGLTDKNGVEIYEGDILCAGNEKYKGVVFYKSSSTQFLVDVFLSGKRVCRNEVSEFIAKRGRAIKSECVVIGNIHQNPELLK